MGEKRRGRRMEEKGREEKSEGEREEGNIVFMVQRDKDYHHGKAW